VASTLRIAQLNMGSLLEPGWAERRHEIVAWLVRLEADIVCLEEAWEDPRTPNSAGWVAEHVPELGYHWVFGGAPFGARLWPDETLRFGSAVLSRWPIEVVTHHRLPVAAGDDDPTVVDVPWELVHARTAGLDVFACHLAAAPTHGLHRRRQVLAIDELIRATRLGQDGPVALGSKRDGMPAILCGDFNAEPDSDEIRFLCSLTPLEGRTTFFQDAWRMAGDGPGFTQDWRTNVLADGMNLNRKRIDYAFVGDAFQRRGDAGRILSAVLAFHEPLTGVLASDHAGLVVDVVWPDRPHLPG
jgi:endonuclease/exonuclease/phosphatase family metal-dependent hydrolase